MPIQSTEFQYFNVFDRLLMNSPRNISNFASNRSCLKLLTSLAIFLLTPLVASATWGWGYSSWSWGSNSSEYCRNGGSNKSWSSYSRGSDYHQKHTRDCYDQRDNNYYKNDCNNKWYYKSKKDRSWYSYDSRKGCWDYECKEGEFECDEEEACETYLEVCLVDKGDGKYYDECGNQWYYRSDRYDCWYVYKNGCWNYLSDSSFLDECVGSNNEAPTADPKTTITEVNVPAVVSLSGSDPEGSDLTFSLASAPSHGSVVVSGTTATYTPSNGYVGTDSFTYVANDGDLDSAAAQVTITVIQPNRPPLASDLTYELVTNEVVQIVLEGSDPDADALTYTILSEPSHGVLVDLGDGVYEYTPDTGYNGDDSFTYQTTDGVLASAVALVTITIACDESTSGEGVFWTENPSSINGTVIGSIRHLTGSGFNFNSGGLITGDIYTPGVPKVRFNGKPTFGEIVEGNGSTSPSGYWVHINNGSEMGDLVIRTDGEPLPGVTAPTAPSGWENWTINSPSAPRPSDWSKVRNLNINSNGGNVDVPPGAYGNFVANNNTSFTLGVAGSSSPAIYSFDNFQWNASSRIVVVGPVVIRTRNQVQANGPAGNEAHPEWMVWEISQGGFVANSKAEPIYAHVYAPNGRVTVNNKATLCGATFSKDLTVNQGGTLSYCAASVECGNEPPVAVDLEAVTLHGTPVSIPLEGSDPEGASISFVLVGSPSNGTVSLVNGVATYVPATGFVGLDSFTYLVNDGELDSEAATVTITVTNGVPVAYDDAGETLKNTPIEFTLTGVDPDGDAITYSLVSSPANGTVSLVGDLATYTPNTGFSGTDSFTFIVNDGFVSSAPATITITVVNTPPTVSDVSATTPRNTPVDLTLPGFDPDGDSLTYQLVGAPENGAVTVIGGVATYTPNAGFVGQDTFTYLANDGEGNSNVATGTVMVQNNPPTADSKSVQTDNVTAIDIVLTGADPDADSLTFAIDSLPAVGILTMIEEDVYRYTPDVSFAGVTTFTYVSNDGIVDSPLATVTITIESSNRRPTAVDLVAETQVGTPVTVTLDGSDPDGDAITYIRKSGPSGGSLTISGDQATYTPNSGFVGTDVFTYVSFDGELESVLHQVVITVVQAGNQAPIAEDLSYTTAVGTPVTMTFSGFDPDGDAISFFQASSPMNGYLIQTGVLTYDYYPIGNFTGTDSFYYIAYDGELISNYALVTITVGEVGNEPPSVDAGLDAIYLLADILVAPGDPSLAAISLDGTVSDDGLPSVDALSQQWTLISAPAGSSVEFVSGSNEDSLVNITNPQEGDYVFRLTASDTVSTVFDEVTITVALANKPPVVLTDLTMTVDVVGTPVGIYGSVTDDGLPFGAPLTSQWEYVYGPGMVTFGDPSSPTTTASFSVPGIYLLELSGDDTEYTSSEVLTVYVDVDCLIEVPNSAVGWWTGNYTNGDYIERRHDLRTHGDPAFTEGAVSLGFLLDGVDDGLEAGITPFSNIGASPAGGFSIEGWFSPDVIAQMPLIEWSNGTSTGISLAMTATGQLSVRLPIVGGSTIQRTYNGAFVAGSLTHIAVTYDTNAGVLRVFRNGVQLSSEGLGSFAFSSSQPIWIGMSIDSTPGHYQGVIDELTIYRAALTPAQVNTIYVSGDIGKCGNPDNI
jgi:hypothetical protein